MKRYCTLTFACLTWPLLAGLVFQGPARAATPSKRWTDEFNVSKCVWSTTGGNDWFVLQPGYQTLFDGKEGRHSVHLAVTVLDETRAIGGVETRIVEERESRDGKLVEVSRNFFAVCGPGKDVFYFGEEVDIYRDGKLAGHEGNWRADDKGAHAGLFMPERPLLGARFYQEFAPGVAMDRIEITANDATLETPEGRFTGLL